MVREPRREGVADVRLVKAAGSGGEEASGDCVPLCSLDGCGDVCTGVVWPCNAIGAWTAGCTVSGGLLLRLSDSVASTWMNSRPEPERCRVASLNSSWMVVADRLFIEADAPDNAVAALEVEAP